MEEGEFVKWKQIVVGLISIMMIFTSVRGEVNENQRSNYQMLEQIEKSYVVDSGFRESNYFFLDMVDSYATYYLQCIKQLIGEEDSVERTDVSYEINCLSNKAVDQWNLLDVYSLIMLVDDVKQIPETLESSIIMYLDSLFDENNGCYQYSREFSVQDSIAPTYYVVVALKKLNQPVRPIKEWIIEISTKALEKDANIQTYYGGYAMLYELMSEYEIPISATDFEQVLEYYHGILKDNTEYELSDIPTIALDFVKLCKNFEKDLTEYNDEISDLFLDSSLLQKYLFWEYDYVNLYAIINTLKQCQLLNENLKWLSEEVALFDQFQLDNGEYISPGIYGSNLNATYYADQFMKLMNISRTYDVKNYCTTIINGNLNLEQFGIWRLSQLLELLQKYHIDWVNSDFGKNVEKYITEQVQLISSSEKWELRELKIINQLFILSQILNETYSIELDVPKIKEQVIKLFNTEISYEDDISISTELLKFLVTVQDTDSELIAQLCSHVNELLEVIGDKNVLFKVTITFDAVKQLQAVNYSISDNAEMAILDMLQGAYWKNGFFKTGDILGEKVLYQATYEGTFLSNLFQGKGGAI